MRKRREHRPYDAESRLEEQWMLIDGFEDYGISNYGRVENVATGRILSLSRNQFGVVNVGLMRDGVQYHRSVPLLVASAFLPIHPDPFNTPINLDGDRNNNHVDNLVWRPRWFASKYNRQFRHPYHNSLTTPLVDIKTGEITENSFECAMRYGLLEEELVMAVLNRTYVWPTYQQFELLRV